MFDIAPTQATAQGRVGDKAGGFRVLSLTIDVYVSGQSVPAA
jgi:hypothetical protein